MSYVYYQPSQQQQKHSRRVQEIKRSPLGSIAAWCIDKATGTWLEGVVKFFVGQSLIGRFASVIVVSIVVGAFLELTIVSIPILSSPTNPVGFAVTAPAILGLLAGAGAGGLGGAIIGGLWGWLVGKIVEPVVTEMIADQVVTILAPIVTWIVAALSGLLAGKATVWGFRKVESKSRGLARVIGMMFVIIAFGAAGIVVYRIASVFIR